MSFNRIRESAPIRNRAGITEPDVVIVLDPSLIKIGDVTSGLKPGGTIIINTTKTADNFPDFEGKWRVAVIDANQIAKEELGVTIVNTTMLGAFIKATGLIGLEAIKEPIKARFEKLSDKNLKALTRAFNETRVEEIKQID